MAGQAVVQLISRHVSGAKAMLTVVATPADALRLLRAGRTDTPYGQFSVQIALVEGDEAYEAFHGASGAALQDTGELRLLVLLPPQLLHIGTLHGSAIRGVGEIKGKKVSIGPSGSRSEKVMLRLLEAFNLSAHTSFHRKALPLAASLKALAERKIDVFAWHGPVSPTLFEHLSRFLGIQMTLLSHEEGIPKLRANAGPAYYPAVIQKGAYPWLEKDVHVVGTRHLLIGRADLSVQLAYDIVKTLSTHPDAFGGGGRGLTDGSAGPEPPMPLPFDPGALKFREESKSG
jgi:TRAP transporter TAXI family solute receptor